MRDGVKLMTDIYRPDADGTYPMLVLRTPYDRTIFHGGAKASRLVVPIIAKRNHDSQTATSS